MSEISEIFAGHRKHGQDKRANNRLSSTEILIERGINFESKNGGIHLVVHYASGVIDFWPSTGKFIFRDKKLTEGRGVFNLLKRANL